MKNRDCLSSSFGYFLIPKIVVYHSTKIHIDTENESEINHAQRSVQYKLENRQNNSKSEVVLFK